MSSEYRNEYLRRLFELSKSNPATWFAFVEAFDAYTTYEIERMLDTPLDQAQVALGMSRRMRDLRSDFMGIEQLSKSLKNASRR